MEELIFFETTVKMPLMNLPVRSTLVHIEENSILISPGSQLKPDDFKSMKEPCDLVAPNLFHCAGIPIAAQYFPTARKWGPQACTQAKPEISWTHELTVQHWPYQNSLPMIFLNGAPKINESVFVHRASRTLIISDLCFNLLEAKGLGARIILGLFGTYKKFAISKFWGKYIKDKKALENSLTHLFSYDFDKIVLSHGFNVNDQAKDKLRSALKERDILVK